MERTVIRSSLPVREWAAAARRARAAVLAAVVAFGPLAVGAQAPKGASDAALAERVQSVVDRPEFRHANWGVEFYSLDSGKEVFSLNGDKFFVPGSTTKLLTMGSALGLLGADYRSGRTARSPSRMRTTRTMRAPTRRPCRAILSW